MCLYYFILAACFGFSGKPSSGNSKSDYLYSPPNIIWVIKSRARWTEHVVGMGDRRGMYRVLVETPEGRMPAGRTRHRW